MADRRADTFGLYTLTFFTTTLSLPIFVESTLTVVVVSVSAATSFSFFWARPVNTESMIAIRTRNFFSKKYFLRFIVILRWEIAGFRLINFHFQLTEYLV